MLAWGAVDITPPTMQTAFVHAVGVNVHGAALVQSTTHAGDNPKQRAFVWQNGRVRILTYAGSGFVDVVAINAKGDVIGDARNEGILWRGTKPTALGQFEPMALNAADEVVGDGNAGGDVHGFLWDNGMLTDLPGLGGNETHAWLIDNRGDVAGVSALPSGVDHAVLWPSGSTTPTDLGSVGTLDSSADSMNAAGTIVGFASDHIGDSRIALEWKDGQLIDLGRFGAQGAQAVAVNTFGDVLVQTQTAAGNPKDVRLVRGGKTLVVAAPRTGYAVATGLDDLGDVLGYLQRPGHGRRTFIWRNGATTLLPTTDGKQPPWGGPSAIANGYAVGDEYVPVSGGDTSHAVLWRR
jgi:uncharacterized membrane protein